MRVLVTGAAGFIGFHVSKRLLSEGHEVDGLDNLNPYYDPELKRARLRILESLEGFRFIHGDLAEPGLLYKLFGDRRYTHVLNMAAQAGVRHSLENPGSYVSANLVGFANLLEACRAYPPKHLVFASSSSVYGLNRKMPFSEHDNVDHPISLYAATKKSGELMAHAYSYLFKIPTTGLRFFTVYGPWGRPDMAIFKFTKAILHGEPIEVYNHGEMRRDFTYVDDVVEGVVRVLSKPAQPNPSWEGESPDPGTSPAPYRVFNIGLGQPVHLLEMIGELEKLLGRKADKRLLPMQPGDVPETYADTSALQEWVGYKPATPLTVGLSRFVRWYIEYYGEEG